MTKSLRCKICNACALMICNFCEIDDMQDFVLMIYNASLRFALIVVCALGATLYVGSINRTADIIARVARKRYALTGAIYLLRKCDIFLMECDIPPCGAGYATLAR